MFCVGFFHCGDCVSRSEASATCHFSASQAPRPGNKLFPAVTAATPHDLSAFAVLCSFQNDNRTKALPGQINKIRHRFPLSGAAYTAAPIRSNPVSSRLPLNTWLPYFRRMSAMLVLPRLHWRPGSSWCQYHCFLFWLQWNPAPIKAS